MLTSLTDPVLSYGILQPKKKFMVNELLMPDYLVFAYEQVSLKKIHVNFF